MSIEIKDVTVSYDTRKFQFEHRIFQDGVVSFISGKNGSGKTTLLKAIAKLLPHTGSISETGTYVAQNPVIFTRSVKENILYPLRVRKLDLSQYEELFKHLCNIFDVERFLDQDATTLSGGEQMKVSIIRALIFKPKVVLLDEPTTHLDLDSIDELIALIKEYKEKMKFIIVSHNRSFIDALMDDEYILE